MLSDLMTGLQNGLELGLAAVAVGIGFPLLLAFLAECVAAMRALDQVLFPR